ncbi:MAG: fasciclin domain-containing protein [Isosphaeraceae bacterium]|nr:fasciclin domain-containing protein [Isosphaeraceae bacterium]
MRMLLASIVAFGLGTSARAADKDIVDTAVAAGSFKTLVAAVQAAGLVDTLKGTGPFTVFAPTDEAFAKLPAGTVESLLRPENKAKLVAILTYHVVPGKVVAADVVQLNGRSAKTVQGAEAPIRVENGSVFVGTAKVLKTDIVTSNGVIHVIDSVLLPPADLGTPAPAVMSAPAYSAVAPAPHYVAAPVVQHPTYATQPACATTGSCATQAPSRRMIFFRRGR